MLPRILLWGAGSQARLIQKIVVDQGLGDVAAIFDPTVDSLPFTSEAVFTNQVDALTELWSSLTHYVVCIGGEGGKARVVTARSLTECGLFPLSIVHRHAFTDSSVRLGPGAQILTRSVVNSYSDLGSDVIVNTAASIDHECRLGDGVHIMGGAVVAGRVTIGDFASVGTNATILPDLVVGEGAVVGAGAVVTKDVEPYNIVVGIPARSVGSMEHPVLEEPLLALRERVTWPRRPSWRDSVRSHFSRE